MKTIIIGDVCGKTGRDVLKRKLSVIKQEYTPDWIIANGENATSGNGISTRHAKQLKESGVDIITSGNHIFARNDWQETVKSLDYILRPHNLIDHTGTGCRVFSFDNKPRLAIINLAGRMFMERARCPFRMFDELYSQLPKKIPVFVDFHAEATSEKQAFFWHVDGRASCVVGTHTHVQTSDERILPAKTAVITDLGMTGAVDGVLGVDKDIILCRFYNGYSSRFQCALPPAKIEGVVVETDGDAKAVAIDRFRVID